jgi:hypothetical protein
MMPAHFMGMDPSTFYNGMPSPVQSSPWPTYMSPSIGSGGTMAPMPTSSFYMSRVPMGGWNLPLYGSNIRYALSGASTQMGAYPTY